MQLLKYLAYIKGLKYFVIVDRIACNDNTIIYNIIPAKCWVGFRNMFN